MCLFIGTLASQMWKTPCHQFNYVQPDERVRWVQEWSKGLRVLTKTDLINSTKSGGTSVSINNHVQMKQSGTAPPGCSNCSDCGLKLRSQDAMSCRHHSSQDYGFSYQILNRANTGPIELIHCQNVRLQEPLQMMLNTECMFRPWVEREGWASNLSVSVPEELSAGTSAETQSNLCNLLQTRTTKPNDDIPNTSFMGMILDRLTIQIEISQHIFGSMQQQFCQETHKDFYNNNNIHALYVTNTQYLCLYRIFRSIASCLVFAWRCESFVWEVLLGA